jgi:hypothetical protein
MEAVPVYNWSPRGCSSMAELQPSKLVMRVRFPSPAPKGFYVPGVLRQSSIRARVPVGQQAARWGRQEQRNLGSSGSGLVPS